MRVINVDYDKLITSKNPMVIYAFADTHIGNIGFKEELLKTHIDMCKREKANWLFLGDWADAILPTDKRFDIRFLNKSIAEQYEIIADMFYPIRKKCMGILSGNHDEKLNIKYGDNVATIGRRLGVPYLGYNAFINIRLWHQKDKLLLKKYPNYSYKLLLYHGRGSGRKLGSKINNIHDLSNMFEADMYLFAHIHTYMHHVDVYTIVKGDKRNKSKLYYKKRHFISPPAYLDGYCEAKDKDGNLLGSSYVEKGAYQPQVLGCVRIELYRCKDEICANVKPVME